MEQRIQEEIKERDLATIKELTLNNFKSKSITGLSEEWKSLENLSINSVGLTTLKGFPNLANLTKLELNDNELCEGLDALTCLPKLTELNLSGNKIKDLDVFESLSEIRTLKNLTLGNCDITQMEGYREKIFELIPSLEKIDGVERSAESEEQENGKHEEEEEDEEVDEEEDLDDEEESLDEEEEDGGEEKDIPLQALYNTINEEGEEEEDDDFVAGEEEDDDDIDDEEIDEDVGAANLSREKVDGKTRGDKRKLEDTEGENQKKK